MSKLPSRKRMLLYRLVLSKLIFNPVESGNCLVSTETLSITASALLR